MYQTAVYMRPWPGYSISKTGN